MEIKKWHDIAQDKAEWRSCVVKQRPLHYERRDERRGQTADVGNGTADDSGGSVRRPAGRQQQRPTRVQPAQPAQQPSLDPLTTSLQQSEPQQSNRAHDAVADSETSLQAPTKTGSTASSSASSASSRTWNCKACGGSARDANDRAYSQSTLYAARAVTSRVADRTIAPGGPKQHVRGPYLTLFIVHAVSGLDGARLGFGDNLVHIQYATHKTRA